MDPATILSIAEILGTSLKLLVQAGNELKHAPDSLAEVTAATTKLRTQLCRLSDLQMPLPPEIRARLDEQVSTAACQDTVRRLQALTGKIAGGGTMGLKDRVRWLWNQGEVEQLVGKLEGETERLGGLLVPEQIMHVLGLTNQVLSTSSQTHSMVTHIHELVSQLSQLSRGGPSAQPSQPPIFDHNGVFSLHSAPGVAWYGQVCLKPSQTFATPYFADRRALADAAYNGDFASVRRLLDKAKSAYNQAWVNTTRLHATTDRPERSGFTVLHQAAYRGSRTATSWLLEQGAWRLSRTHNATERVPCDATPLDVARAQGWEYLYGPLSPVIRRPLRGRTLARLQDQLHELIRLTFGAEADPDAHLECFTLPELEVMTEHSRSRLWFPLEPEKLDTREGRAVHVLVDGTELVVVMRWGKGSGKGMRQTYRVNGDRWREVGQAVVLS